MRYKVGVGKAGKQWAGVSQIDGKYTYPAWSPPPDMLRGRAPYVIPGGSPQNPMGVAALTLADTEFAIHGTNAPNSIGGFVSNGCIRMHNHDIADLYQRVQVGTPVVVVTRANTNSDAGRRDTSAHGRRRPALTTRSAVFAVATSATTRPPYLSGPML